ncbi:hypothetical protein MU0083_001430 [[Mycobacterium] kokjensenii]|uniref:Uncharacterized protein n=1 Tax=[Mycobacterium] kokjensenii TaxID=3064287 RepID=A0ABM9LC44_9MYCO|nr:hypothetical protein [Mycolicibacter sp. MU0083]CAJ1496482.1 hypothetical protein MU0083_001430 [Mycolicibacter sp. MU0083]
MTSGDEHGNGGNPPTVEVEFGDNGRVKLTAVIDTALSKSLLSDPDSIASIADNEFTDVQHELTHHAPEDRSAKDSAIYQSVASFDGGDDLLVFQGTLTIEFTRCDATDPRCNDIVGAIINDAIRDLRKWLRAELESRCRGE